MIVQKVLLSALYLACLFIPALVSAQLSLFTDSSVGDSIAIDPSFKSNGGMIVFTDQKACVICYQKIQNAVAAAKSEGMPVTIYMVGMKQVVANAFAKTHEFDGEIVSDDLGAYARLFQIKAYPVLMVVRPDAKLAFVGVPSSPDIYDQDALDLAIKSAKTHVSASPYPPATRRLTAVKRLTFASADSLNAGDRPIVKFNQISRRYIVLNRAAKLALIFGEDGTYVSQHKVTNEKFKFTPYNPSLLDVFTDSSTAYFFDSDMFTNTPYLYKLNLSDEIGDTLPMPVADFKRLSNARFYDPTTSRVWVLRRPFDSKGVNQNDDGILAISEQNGQFKKVGQFPSAFKKFYAAPFYFGIMTPTKTGVALVVNLTDSLYVFSPDGTSVRTYPIPVPAPHQPEWESKFRDLSAATPPATMNDLAIRRHRPYIMFGTSSTDEIVYIGAMSRAVYDTAADKGETGYIGAIVNGASGATGDWFSIPYGYVPVARNGNHIITQTRENGKLEVVWFDLR